MGNPWPGDQVKSVERGGNEQRVETCEDSEDNGKEVNLERDRAVGRDPWNNLWSFYFVKTKQKNPWSLPLGLDQQSDMIKVVFDQEKFHMKEIKIIKVGKLFMWMFVFLILNT